MLNLCIAELHRVIGGELKLGMMPPLAGDMEPIRRIVVDSAVARPGDVFWALCGPNYDGACMAEEAYARGALGIVASARHVEPWAGKFSLRVPNANEALLKFAEHQRLKFVARTCRPLAFHAGDTSGMVSALFRGSKISIEDMIKELSRRKALVA